METKPKLREILAEAVLASGISKDEFLARRKPNGLQHVHRARDAAMLKARLAGYSNQKIGAVFNRHHTSVTDAIQREMARQQERRGGAS